MSKTFRFWCTGWRIFFLKCVHYNTFINGTVDTVAVVMVPERQTEKDRQECNEDAAGIL